MRAQDVVLVIAAVVAVGAVVVQLSDLLSRNRHDRT